MVAGIRYYTATGPLPTTRDTESHKNRVAANERMDAVINGAKMEGSQVPA